MLQSVWAPFTLKLSSIAPTNLSDCSTVMLIMMVLIIALALFSYWCFDFTTKRLVRSLINISTEVCQVSTVLQIHCLSFSHVCIFYFYPDSFPFLLIIGNFEINILHLSQKCFAFCPRNLSHFNISIFNFSCWSYIYIINNSGFKISFSQNCL